LSELPLVVFEAGSSTRLLINEWFLQAGLRIKPVMELGSIGGNQGNGSLRGWATALCRAWPSRAHHRRGLHVQPLTPGLSRTLGIALRQDKPVNNALRQVWMRCSTSKGHEGRA
ncbi:LysR family transcriptional regulator substrate-binding protein, partial [Pseudomonas syringae pv. actinidiae]|nr:LysR family transcriptional regulator substrate-binding protein [Pseudomonas syringae pv. actinidiae]